MSRQNIKYRKDIIGNLLEKKKKLKEGEMIQLCYDEAFKIMFANSEHIEILTMLLSKYLRLIMNY